MADLAHAQAEIELAAGYVRQSGRDQSVIRTKLLIVVDRHEFRRGCLSSWFDHLGAEFEVVDVADAQLSLTYEQIEGASAVIFSIGDQMAGEAWLEQQVEWLRMRRPSMPIAALLDSCDVKGDQLVARLSLQGHIPTSSTIEIVKAALRLIAVGGDYFPDRPRGGSSLSGTEPVQIADMPPFIPNLTSRELLVLELLRQGMANKIVAYRLGMSQGTVKVHVHNSIKKLNVSNRTEAAVFARN